ncbi:hypothetical protein Dsin_006250 [Dipteronia sinensis]|uniref:Reverse transcriptase zinc-binding domain-containing protein n=1 Tax=Dipteronia sinensis TaxID=43782 RepID=A0AAE0EFD9_9ROSI|nr:hypothetical protein Dsin_006250 [Dipteronia sinensis]
MASCPSPSNSLNGQHWWVYLWKLALPLKIKIFIWRACHDWIPTMVNLEKRGLKVDRVFPLCKKNDESTMHALWDCQKLKYARNSFVHSGGSQSYSEVVEWSRNVVGGCQAPNAVRDRSLNFVLSKDCIWKAPELGVYKVNCNARVDVGSRRVGFGIVIRDGSGSVMASCSQITDATYNDQVAGLMAIYMGFIFSKDCGLAPPVFESDKVGAVSCVLNASSLGASYGNIIAVIAGLRSVDNGMNTRAISGLANRVAQCLASLALVKLINSFWMEDFPSCIRGMLGTDKHVYS